MELPEPERCIKCRHEVNPGGLRFGLCPDCMADITIRQKHNIIEQELNAMSPTGKLAQRECPECHEMIDPRAWTCHWRKAHPDVQMPRFERKHKPWNRKPKPEQPPAQPQATGLTDAQQAIAEVCDELKAMLLGKNASYGNSVFEPVRIFSHADPREQIAVRLDDKLSRLMRGHAAPGDNDKRDFIGYLIIDLAYEKLEAGEEKAEVKA
ncbi:MAG TPA: hypothetical protein VM223_25740 [Planctomycetota bacterium]|nr:hypothetical protein [Planctomycetota bacterium]